MGKCEFAAVRLGMMQVGGYWVAVAVSPFVQSRIELGCSEAYRSLLLQDCRFFGRPFENRNINKKSKWRYYYL